MRLIILRKPLRNRARIRFLGTSLLLAIGASCAFSTRVSAIETITLVFNESRVSVPFSDFQTFVKTGETQRTSLQTFLARVPRTSQAARSVLTREIEITRPFSERNFDNPIADFLLLQLSSALTVPDNLQPLRSALITSYRSNQRISMLEVIGNYPAAEVVVQLPRVERAYNRMSALVQRVQPALESSKLFLQNLVCNCPTTTTRLEEKSLDQVAVNDAANECP